eukprot:TRINITY_DN9528_c0_g1_i1.p1 TRINITY_DN9528_c0_g1~~TRINITY_DN9528_c0_g1_i1.p1  ORF type:complete len:848 (+),score=226.20 TRINITY_DN9528_c0_g1_i1:34-2577(+)
MESHPGTASPAVPAVPAAAAAATADRTPLATIGIANGLFLGSMAGFTCTIKGCPSDFVVSEIDITTRKPVALTSFDLPAPPAADPVHAPIPTLKTPAAAAPAAPEAAPEDGWRAELLRLIDGPAEEVMQQLTALDAAGRAATSSSADTTCQSLPSVSIPVPPPGGKAARARVHRAVRSVFPFVQTDWAKSATCGGASKSSGGGGDPVADGGDGAGGDGGSKLSNDAGDIVCSVDVTVAHLNGLISSEDVEAVQRFIHEGAVNFGQGTGNVIVRASDDKAVRGDTHRGIIKACPALQTRAQVDKDGSQMIAVSWTKTINRKRKRQHELQDSSVPVAAENVLLSFVLRKENKEHGEALDALVRATHSAHSAFSFAGTKDKLAITHQKCVVRGVSAKALLRTNGTIPGVQVGNFTILSRNANLLQLGEQGGNHFKIVLRNLTASHAQLRAAVEEIARTGFINFFGTQRIGSSAHGGAMSYQVGLHLLKGDFEGAAVLLLRPARVSDRAAHNSPTVPSHTHSASNGTATTASDAPAVGAACTDGSIAAASTAQPMDAEASAAVPAGTGSGSTDEGGAMGEGPGAETADASERDGPERAGNGKGGSRGGGLSRAAAALSKFVESARGVRDAKECLRELSGGGRHGHARERALLQGYVRNQSWQQAMQCLNYHMRTMWLHSYQAYMWNKMASARVLQLGPVAVAGDLIALPDGETGPPTVLGAEVPEDERRALFSRVVLPMPGRSVQYPQHCVGELYRQMIDDDGVKFDRQGYTLKGTYRSLLCVPTDMRWQLATTTADNGAAATDTAALSADSGAALQEAVVEFALKPGAYATMTLRELTKCNTDIACVPKR